MYQNAPWDGVSALTARVVPANAPILILDETTSSHRCQAGDARGADGAFGAVCTDVQDADGIGGLILDKVRTI